MTLWLCSQLVCHLYLSANMRCPPCVSERMSGLLFRVIFLLFYGQTRRHVLLAVLCVHADVAIATGVVSIGGINRRSTLSIPNYAFFFRFVTFSTPNIRFVCICALFSFSIFWNKVTPSHQLSYQQTISVYDANAFNYYTQIDM